MHSLKTQTSPSPTRPRAQALKKPWVIGDTASKVELGGAKAARRCRSCCSPSPIARPVLRRQALHVSGSSLDPCPPPLASQALKKYNASRKLKKAAQAMMAQQRMAKLLEAGRNS